MSRFALRALVVALLSLWSSIAPASGDTPIDYGTNAPTATDDAAIHALLDAYTTSVGDGDERRFKTLLLSDRIPFTGVDATIASRPGKPFDDVRFDDFDRAIFGSGVKYEQSFHNVHVLQDGALAQVSLDFITKDAQTGSGGWGWKILQLVKIDDAWKIASEFYTFHALPR